MSKLEIPCDFCKKAKATRQDYRTSNRDTEADQTDKHLVCDDCFWLSDEQLRNKQAKEQE